MAYIDITDERSFPLNEDAYRTIHTDNKGVILWSEVLQQNIALSSSAC